MYNSKNWNETLLVAIQILDLKWNFENDIVLNFAAGRMV